MTGSAPESRCRLCQGPVAARYQFEQRWVVYCRRCRLGQLEPQPTPEELDSLYTSRSYFEGTDSVGYSDYLADSEQFSLTFREKATGLLRHGPIRDLAEIGCGPGQFLLEAARVGIENVVGVDYNPWAIDQVRQRGLSGYVGSIEALPADAQFDAIVMLDLLEHVTDPVEFLGNVRKRLRAGGRVLIMTPNIRSLLAMVSRKKWVSFKIPEHVFYYSPRSIRLLLEGAGFEVLSIRSAGQYVTVGFVLSRLARLLPHVTTLLDRVCRSLRLTEKIVFVTNGSIDVVARLR